MLQRLSAHKIYRLARAFTMAELLVALGVAGLVMAMSLATLFNNPPSKRWGRMADDMVTHLAATYHTYQLETGWPLVHAGHPDGASALLPLNDTSGTHNTLGTEYLDYQGGFRLYLKPEQLAATVTGLNNTILADTQNREWLLLDMDAASAPTNLSTDPDLVLLRIHNDTGQVLTAHQVEPGTFAASFYDTYKGY
jgi:hypothetical protein